MEYEQLEQADEDALHTSRLLQVEEKPFKRITKRLLNAESLISSPLTSLPTPPPDADTATETQDTATAVSTAHSDALRKQYDARAAWRSDVILDFDALESSIARIQLLRSSNEAERERYAAERERIIAEATSIRESTVDLRARLAEAREVLERRKAYDVLAERITSNRMLKSRGDQATALEKLDAEIAALERESSEYKATWVERRVQFGKIVEEGRQMLMLIRDEKEEAERKEGMEGDDDGDGDGDEVGSGRDGGASLAGTPKPDFGGSTPMHSGHEAESLSGTRMLHKDRLAPGTMNGSSRAPTPARHISVGRDEPGDTEMADSKAEDDDEEDEGEVRSHSGSAEEGEHIEDEGAAESMDMT